ncbi:olfactory receptor 2A14-like [Danio rerio]|uniref:Olfactory receptor 2A14-like n=1 Tax=Danio rerio TaxID=7955 RepID=A0AC58IDA9_DANRE
MEKLFMDQYNDRQLEAISDHVNYKAGTNQNITSVQKTTRWHYSRHDNLCITGVYGATGFYPKFLSDLILDSYVISSHMCALQTYVIYSSLLSDITILTVMSYDRYVAICKPLNYHSKLTKLTCAILILLSWIVPNFSVIPAIMLAHLRPFCKYHIDKFYWSIVKLSCASSFVNNVYSYNFSIIFISCALIIIVSYIKLVAACTKSLENRKKVWQTCLPHLFSLMN